MKRDTLFLINPDFADPAFPGARFFCWHCALMEGVLASFPWLADRIDVVRVDWAWPRQPVIDLIGVENQTLPLLVLADPLDAGGARRDRVAPTFVAEKDAILAALSERHGLPQAHP